jgi:hypothetical protein
MYRAPCSGPRRYLEMSGQLKSPGAPVPGKLPSHRFNCIRRLDVDHSRWGQRIARYTSAARPFLIVPPPPRPLSLPLQIICSALHNAVLPRVVTRRLLVIALLTVVSGATCTEHFWNPYFDILFEINYIYRFETMVYYFNYHNFGHRPSSIVLPFILKHDVVF